MDNVFISSAKKDEPSRRFHVDFDNNYKGITYDKCLQILKVLNVKRKSDHGV